MAEPSRQELLWSWRTERSLEALGELLKAQRGRAYSIAFRLTGSGADAEDAVQEAFIKLLSRRKGFENLDEFDVNVYRAVVQCSLDARRSERRRAAREEKAGRSAAAAAAGTGAEAEMSETEMRELRERLRTAVAELPEEQRAPAVLCYYHGMSEARAAEVLEVPRTTLRRRLSNALHGLRVRAAKRGAFPAVALLLSVMGGDDALRAPDSLCAALDRSLPGRPCSEIPTVPGGEAALTAPAASGAAKSAIAVSAAALLAIAALVAGSRFAGDAGSRPGPSAKRSNGREAATVAADEDAKQKEEPVMKKKMAGIGALAGGLLLSGAAAASEPKAEVAGVIAKIRARQAAKAEAAKKDAADRAKAYEGRRKVYGQ